MRALHLAASAALVALVTTACSNDVLSPRALTPAAPLRQAAPKGTGVTLDVVPTVTLPLGLGGPATINQAVITNFALVEAAGQIVGLQVTGTLDGTALDALGNAIGVSVNPFTANAAITSSGPGQCSVVTLDLSTLTVNTLVANLTVPAKLDVKGSGAVGSLLCNLGSLLNGLTSGLSGGSGAQGVVNALNNQIGG